MVTAIYDLTSPVSENNENRNVLNKMDKISRRRTSQVQVAQSELPKTPRSTKKTVQSAGSSRAKREEENREATARFLEGEQDSEVDPLHGSPPKQRKLQPLPQHLISPSRLLDRLSIDERQEEEVEATTHKTETAEQQPKHQAKDEAKPRPKQREDPLAQKQQEKPPTKQPNKNQTKEKAISKPMRKPNRITCHLPHATNTKTPDEFSTAPRHKTCQDVSPSSKSYVNSSAITWKARLPAASMSPVSQEQARPPAYRYC